MNCINIHNPQSSGEFERVYAITSRRNPSCLNAPQKHSRTKPNSLPKKFFHIQHAYNHTACDDDDDEANVLFSSSTLVRITVNGFMSCWFIHQQDETFCNVVDENCNICCITLLNDNHELHYSGYSSHGDSALERPGLRQQSDHSTGVNFVTISLGFCRLRILL